MSFGSAFVFAATCLIGCGMDSGKTLCTTDVEAVVWSPNGSLKAIQYHRDCGVGSPQNTQISMVEAAANDEGSIEQGMVFSVGGLHDLEPEWVSNNNLKIRRQRDKIFRQETRRGALHIEYRE